MAKRKKCGCKEEKASENNKMVKINKLDAIIKKHAKVQPTKFIQK